MACGRSPKECGSNLESKDKKINIKIFIGNIESFDCGRNTVRKIIHYGALYPFLFFDGVKKSLLMRQ